MDHRRETTKYIERHTLKSMLTIILIHIKEHHIPKVNMESLMPNTMRKVIREEVETMRLIKHSTIKSTSLVNINNSIDKQLFLTVEQIINKIQDQTSTKVTLAIIKDREVIDEQRFDYRQLKFEYLYC